MDIENFKRRLKTGQDFFCGLKYFNLKRFAILTESGNRGPVNSLAGFWIRAGKTAEHKETHSDTHGAKYSITSFK